ncbi:MAG: L-Ala-D/L-Glu epimerase [Thermoleophilaceae bacterium]|jgi:muconate cycloisomerase|nr:L-Ala-D/L-Glu epimerase [Thermoleophilaceae bacterium]
MRITSIEAIPVRVPRAKPMLSAGTADPIVSSDFGIVRLRVDDGPEGLGEISMNGACNGAILCEAVVSTLAPALIGRDPRAVQLALAEMDRLLEGAEPAKAGIEMAMLDAVGKALGVPVYQLLGGRARQRIPVRWGLGFGDPGAGIAELRTRIDEGFRSVKLKVGRPDTDLDLEMVSAVREEFGASISLMVDANAGYVSVAQALRELGRLTPFDLELVEQPLARDRLDDLATLRGRLPVPILADESMRHPSDAYLIARAGAADVLSVYVCEAGGLIPAAKAFAVAEAAGLSCTIGSQCELGIGTAAMAHLGVAMRNLAYASDITGHLRYPEDVIRESLDYEDGTIRPSSRPGLGVTIAEDRLERWRLDGGGA